MHGKRKEIQRVSNRLVVLKINEWIGTGDEYL